jgi:alkylation response protein AidB-like acyl-CoA dehydrogenase
MDLGLSEQQELLKNAARDFLEKECPETLVREMEEDEKGYSPGLWKQMAEQGWQGLLIPEAYGGADFSYLDLIILIEEFGRALVPGPFVSTQVGGVLPLLEGGTEQQKQYALPKIASGETIWTLAYTEPSARFDTEGVALEVKEDGNDLVLNGTKLFVRDGNVADYFTVVGRKPGTKGDDGIELVIVDAKTSGITITLLKTIAADKQAEVKFENVKVPKESIIAGGAALLKKVQRKATVLECAYLVGLAQMDFDISVQYAKDRIQFGRPIGSFQAIQHKAADMVTDVDGSRFITYRAAWSVDQDEDEADLNVNMAKAWVSEATRRVVAHGQQIHGGIGFTKDYKVQLYFRRQKAAELAWGDGDYHREAVAEALAI